MREARQRSYLAYCGPRRGEACGHLARQKPPKSKAGNRDLTLDADTTAVLTAYHARRNTQRLKAGPAWPGTGLFFVRPD
ncbi:hypothetical protein [Polymorphospora rubra]|uniref:hypothetical protein n=1 Tax=Polymorphospora rubra TaxID=338584 RepID=UPI003400B389